MLGRFEVGERHLIEALDYGPKPVEIFLLPAGGERRQRAAMERALEGDDAVPLGMAGHRLVFTRRLDRAFHGFGAGIAEEGDVGKARGAQPLCHSLGFRYLVKI